MEVKTKLLPETLDSADRLGKGAAQGLRKTLRTIFNGPKNKTPS
jgi:hypothetical protein